MVVRSAFYFVSLSIFDRALRFAGAVAPLFRATRVSGAQGSLTYDLSASPATVSQIRYQVDSAKNVFLTKQTHLCQWALFCASRFYINIGGEKIFSSDETKPFCCKWMVNKALKEIGQKDRLSTCYVDSRLHGNDKHYFCLFRNTRKVKGRPLRSPDSLCTIQKASGGAPSAQAKMPI